MATITGLIRIIKEDARGQRDILIDGLPTALTDQANPDMRPWVNYKGAAGNARIVQVYQTPGVRAGRPELDVAYPGEYIIIQERAQTQTALVSLGASVIELPVLDFDQNHPEQGSYLTYKMRQDRNTTKVADNATVSATVFTDIYAFLVPDRHTYLFGGGPIRVTPSDV